MALLWQFRPRVLPVIAVALALSLVAVFAVIWLRLPEQSQRSFTAFQRVTLVVLATAVLGILYRMATLRVAAYDDGVVVRNVFRSYRIGWHRIRALRFSAGDPWLQLFDADGNRLGVLAIQAADGARAATAARHLATLTHPHLPPR